MGLTLTGGEEIPHRGDWIRGGLTRMWTSKSGARYNHREGSLVLSMVCGSLSNQAVLGDW